MCKTEDRLVGKKIYISEVGMEDDEIMFMSPKDVLNSGVNEDTDFYEVQILRKGKIIQDASFEASTPAKKKTKKG